MSVWPSYKETKLPPLNAQYHSRLGTGGQGWEGGHEPIRHPEAAPFGRWNWTKTVVCPLLVDNSLHPLVATGRKIASRLPSCPTKEISWHGNGFELVDKITRLRIAVEALYHLTPSRIRSFSTAEGRTSTSNPYAILAGVEAITKKTRFSFGFGSLAPLKLEPEPFRLSWPKSYLKGFMFLGLCKPCTGDHEGSGLISPSIQKDVSRTTRATAIVAVVRVAIRNTKQPGNSAVTRKIPSRSFIVVFEVIGIPILEVSA